MALIVRFGEHPLVEGEPRQLPIDKASGGMGDGGTAFDWLRAGVHADLPEKQIRPTL